MPWWHGKDSNVNDKFRTSHTEQVRSLGELPRRLGSQQAANEVNAAHATLVALVGDVQDKKHLRNLQEAMKLVLTSGDKRRCPRGVSKKDFKLLRSLKLTRTAKLRHKT